MRQIRIGYDLDGVIACWNEEDKETLKSTQPESPAEHALYLNLMPNKDCLAKPVGTIITSRPSYLEGLTRQWLKTHNITYQKLFCIGDTQLYKSLCGQASNSEAEYQWGISQAIEKSKIIKQERLLVYLEDRKDVVDILTISCPETLIMWYQSAKIERKA